MTEGVHSSMVYLIYYKNHCKSHSEPQRSSLSSEKKIIVEDSKLLRIT
jgi:hypothetical protein